MSQVNINAPPPGERPVETVDTSGDRTAAAGINLITVLIVLAVLAVIAWYLFTGPLRSLGSGGTTNVNVPNPAGNTGGSSGGNTGGSGSTGAGNTGSGSGNTGTRP